MPLYVVLDTNVLVSSLLSTNADSATVLVLKALFSDKVTPIYSKAILDEYINVLHRAKFGFPHATIDYLLQTIINYGLCIDPSPSGCVLPDMKDLPFYEVVLEKKDDNAYLVTGNIRHFPKEPFVVTPREFLTLIKL